MEELPAGAPVRALVEVADVAEQQRVDSAADVDWTWLHRDGVPAGRSGLLVEAVQATDLGRRPQVWVGAEADVVHKLREHCRTAVGLGRDRVYALAYWRQGTSG